METTTRRPATTGILSTVQHLERCFLGVWKGFLLMKIVSSRKFQLFSRLKTEFYAKKTHNRAKQDRFKENCHLILSTAKIPPLPTLKKKQISNVFEKSHCFRRILWQFCNNLVIIKKWNQESYDFRGRRAKIMKKCESCHYSLTMIQKIKEDLWFWFCPNNRQVNGEKLFALSEWFSFLIQIWEVNNDSEDLFRKTTCLAAESSLLNTLNKSSTSTPSAMFQKNDFPKTSVFNAKNGNISNPVTQYSLEITRFQMHTMWSIRTIVLERTIWFTWDWLLRISEEKTSQSNAWERKPGTFAFSRNALI